MESEVNYLSDIDIVWGHVFVRRLQILGHVLVRRIQCRSYVCMTWVFILFLY